jgi:hypothetical protein
MVRLFGKTVLLLAILAMATVVISQNKPVTIKGYLLDKMCSTKAMKAKDPEAAAKAHTKQCADECASSGYGVVSGNKYYLFDAKGNELAEAMLKNTKKTDGLGIEVVGTLDGDKINVQNLTETP